LRRGRTGGPKRIAHYRRVFVAYQKFLPWVAKAYIRAADGFEKMGKRQDAIENLREMLHTNVWKNSPSNRSAQASATMGCCMSKTTILSIALVVLAFRAGRICTKHCSEGRRTITAKSLRRQGDVIMATQEIAGAAGQPPSTAEVGYP
jgi:hypothetical protein